MELDNMNLKEVEERLTALDIEVRSFDKAEDVDRATEEKKKLLARKNELVDLEARKQTALDLSSGAKTGTVKETRKDEKRMNEIETRDAMLATKEYRSAFMKQLMGLPLTVEERTTYFDTTAAAGGYAVPTETANSIFDFMVKTAPMLGEITLWRGSPYLKFPKEGTRTAVSAVHTENAVDTPATDSLSYLSLTGYEFTKVQRVSASLSIRSVPAFEAWLVKALGEDIGRAVDNYIINGSGSGEPDGILYAKAWTDNTNAIDYGTGLTFEHLVAGIALLPARADANAKFVMKKSIFWNQVVNLKNAVGDPLVARDATGTPVGRLLGYPVLIDDYAPANTIFLGDYSKMYGSMPQDINVARSVDSGFLANAVDYRGSCIFDCGAIDPDVFIKIYT